MINSLISLNKIDRRLDYIKTNWNTAAKKQGFPIVKNFSGERKAQWIRILKKHTEKALWDEFFIILSKDESRWLASATVGSSNFKWFNIDFFYKNNKEDRIIKFVEGFYLRGNENKKQNINCFYNSEANTDIALLIEQNEIQYEG